MIAFTIPIHTKSASNLREHWAARVKRVKAQRAATALCMPPAAKLMTPPLVVKLVRQSPRKLDDDNLRGALKAIRDEVANKLRVDDGSDLIRWEYGQQKGPPAVLVTIDHPKLLATVTSG